MFNGSKTLGGPWTQFQFSVCMYGTCGRIDNKADFDFDFDFLKMLHFDDKTLISN